MHSCIERNIRHVEIYTPEQYMVLNRSAKNTRKKYQVGEMSKNDVFD